jgi:hypothetical protein
MIARSGFFVFLCFFAWVLLLVGSSYRQQIGMAWREHVVLDKPERIIGEPAADGYDPCSFTNWQKSSAYMILACVPADGRERDSSQPRSNHFCISSGRVCKARESEYFVNHSRPLRPPMPRRCNIERTEPAGRRRIFAASPTGIVVIARKTLGFAKSFVIECGSLSYF